MEVRSRPGPARPGPGGPGPRDRAPAGARGRAPAPAPAPGTPLLHPRLLRVPLDFLLLLPQKVSSSPIPITPVRPGPVLPDPTDWPRMFPPISGRHLSNENVSTSQMKMSSHHIRPLTSYSKVERSLDAVIARASANIPSSLKSGGHIPAGPLPTPQCPDPRPSWRGSAIPPPLARPDPPDPTPPA